MLSWLRKSARLKRTSTLLYGRIVAQARTRQFYEFCGVPDTMEGRIEMIVLHLFLTLERLKSEGASSQLLGQAIMERFVADMDDALRQIGIGDMGVPRRVKKAAAALIERSAAYDAALKMTSAPAKQAALEVALGHFVLGEPDMKAQDEHKRRLADYVQQAVGTLDKFAGADLLLGELPEFPPPTPIARPE